MKNRKVTYVCERCGQTTTMTANGDCTWCVLDKTDQLINDLSEVRECLARSLSTADGFIQEIGILNDEITKLAAENKKLKRREVGK